MNEVLPIPTHALIPLSSLEPGNLVNDVLTWNGAAWKSLPPTGGGGGAGDLQGAYDEGNNVLLATNRPIAIRTGGNGYNRLPFIGMFIDSSPSQLVPLGIMLDKNSGVPSVSMFTEFLDELPVTFPAPTTIDIGAVPLPPWFVFNSIPLYAMIKNANVPAENGLYAVIGIAGSQMILFDVVAVALASFTSTSATVLLST
jgi:hypothetical protein